MSESERFIHLPDGRKLGFNVLGDPEGTPLFMFHGTPGSRLVHSADDPLGQAPGLKLITTDRPGYGLSDPKPDRTLLDWPDDVVALSDHLGLEHFAVGGESGGGPHALACAFKLKGRVTAALVLGSPAPPGVPGATKGMSLGNRLAIVLEKWAPRLVEKMIVRNAAAFEKAPERFLDALAFQMAESDRKLLQGRTLREGFVRDLQEAYRQGAGAQVVDGRLALGSRAWGFDLGAISVPVYLWHGEADRLVSMNMARHLASAIPTCRARFLPGKGHLLSEYPEVVEEMLEVLGVRVAQ